MSEVSVIECPAEIDCGYGIADHNIVFIEDGIIKVFCPGMEYR